MSVFNEAANAAPCRHRGAPNENIVEQIIQLFSAKLGADKLYLASHGLTPAEYEHALPTAIERLRGSMAASNQERRGFVEELMDLLVSQNIVQRYLAPKYGDHTVYRIFLKDGRQVGLIQKGCPDGKHSSVAWRRPDWAEELYLWWVCDSKSYEPGEHVWKGVNRLRGKVSVPSEDQLDGIIFYSQSCGSADRPCPKMAHAVVRNGISLPPPCIYVFPKWEKGESNLNWRGEVQRHFPAKVLKAFGISEAEAPNYIGHVGFRLSGGEVTATEITSRFGKSKTTTARG